MNKEEKEAWSKPVPVRDEESAAFFADLAEGRLLIKRSRVTGRFAHPSASYCPDSLTALEWTEASGAGTVFSWTAVHQAGHPAFAADVPYVLGTVKLAEGPLFLSKIVGSSPAEVSIGMPVHVQFVTAENGETLPVFVKASVSST